MKSEIRGLKAGKYIQDDGDAILDISKKDDKDNVLIGDILIEDSSHNYIYSSKKLVTTCGVKNIIIINTED